MKRRYFVTALVAAILALAGCAPPVGMLGGSSAKPNRTMWVIPNRVLYDGEHSNIFYRKYDLRIFWMENGAVENIDPMREDVIITIFYYPLSVVNPEEAEGSWNVEERHPFGQSGRYEVHVEFKGETDHYSVEVRGYGTNPDPAGDQFGTHIIWW